MTGVPPALYLAVLLGTAGALGVLCTRLVRERHTAKRRKETRERFAVQQRFRPDALVGRMVSRYRIEEQLGIGGMGTVYRARDTAENRDVAIKVLLGGRLAGESQRRRFRREARVHERFRPPGAAALYEFDSQDGADFMVMEFVPGVSLAERLREGPVPEREALRIGCEVTEVLVEAHARGIVHRDIKPANVILTPGGRAKLLDFGVALLTTATTTTTSARLTETGVIVGSPAYVAPELIRGEKAGPAADLYGIGMLLFEMTTGRRPFPDDHPRELMHVILHQRPPSPRVLNARLTPQVEAIILRALEKRPETRYESARELLDELRSVAG